MQSVVVFVTWAAILLAHACICYADVTTSCSMKSVHPGENTFVTCHITMPTTSTSFTPGSFDVRKGEDIRFHCTQKSGIVYSCLDIQTQISYDVQFSPDGISVPVVNVSSDMGGDYVCKVEMSEGNSVTARFQNCVFTVLDPVETTAIPPHGIQQTSSSADISTTALVSQSSSSSAQSADLSLLGLLVLFVIPVGFILGVIFCKFRVVKKKGGRNDPRQFITGWEWFKDFRDKRQSVKEDITDGNQNDARELLRVANASRNTSDIEQQGDLEVGIGDTSISQGHGPSENAGLLPRNGPPKDSDTVVQEEETASVGNGSDNTRYSFLCFPLPSGKSRDTSKQRDKGDKPKQPSQIFTEIQAAPETGGNVGDESGTQVVGPQELTGVLVKTSASDVGAGTPLKVLEKSNSLGVENGPAPMSPGTNDVCLASEKQNLEGASTVDRNKSYPEKLKFTIPQQASQQNLERLGSEESPSHVISLDTHSEGCDLAENMHEDQRDAPCPSPVSVILTPQVSFAKAIVAAFRAGQYTVTEDDILKAMEKELQRFALKHKNKFPSFDKYFQTHLREYFWRSEFSYKLIKLLFMVLSRSMNTEVKERNVWKSDDQAQLQCSTASIPLNQIWHIPGHPQVEPERRIQVVLIRDKKNDKCWFRGE